MSQGSMTTKVRAKRLQDSLGLNACLQTKFQPLTTS